MALQISCQIPREEIQPGYQEESGSANSTGAANIIGRVAQALGPAQRLGLLLRLRQWMNLSWHSLLSPGLVPTSITQRDFPERFQRPWHCASTHTSKAVSTFHHTGHSAGVRKGCNVFQGTYASLVSAWHRVVTEQVLHLTNSFFSLSISLVPHTVCLAKKGLQMPLVDTKDQALLEFYPLPSSL